jgi:hypothetical protein
MIFSGVPPASAINHGHSQAAGSYRPEPGGHGLACSMEQAPPLAFFERV